MFQPPRCPNTTCPEHYRPQRRFYLRRGFYHPKCRPRPIPRFQCRTCRRGFSRQTFRSDYRDHRPDLNLRLLLSIASGLGLRQTSRNLGLTLRSTELKFRKIARHLRDLNVNLRGPLAPGTRLQFDEFETYESRRNSRPISVSVLIDRETRFIIWMQTAPIRPHGRMSEVRKQAILEDERRFGARKDTSRAAVLATLRQGAELVRHLDHIVLETDEKTTYPGFAALAFGASRLVHRRTNSKLARTTWNPLFPINHTEAKLRDLCGRLRRRSWLVSKKREFLELGLHVHAAYCNYLRRRYNYDEESPAQLAGFVKRRLSAGELLSWRQDWGPERSLQPLARAAA